MCTRAQRLTFEVGVFGGFIRRDRPAMIFRESFSLVVCLGKSLISALGVVNYLLKGPPTPEALVCTWWRE